MSDSNVQNEPTPISTRRSKRLAKKGRKSYTHRSNNKPRNIIKEMSNTTETSTGSGEKHNAMESSMTSLTHIQQKIDPVCANLHAHPEQGFVNFKQPDTKNKVDLSFEDVLLWTSTEVEKTSIRLGHVESKVHECLNKNIENTEGIATISEIAANNSTRISALDSDLVKISNQVADNEERINEVENTQAESLKGAQIAVNLQIDEIKEIIQHESDENQRKHSEARAAVGILARKIDTIEKTSKARPTGPAAYVKTKSLPLNADVMKSNDVVFNHSNKYHPHLFIALFENYIDGISIEDGQKCTLFRSVIDMNDDWKTSQIGVRNYDELKENFLDEYWSKEEQTQAYTYFERRVKSASSTRALARLYQKWLQTLKHINKLDEEDIMTMMYEKLPYHLQNKITTEDQKSLEAFGKRIKEFTKVRENPIGRPQIEIEIGKKKNNVEEPKKLSRPNRYQQKSGQSGRESAKNYYDRNNSTYKKRDNSDTRKSDDQKSEDRKNEKKDNDKTKKFVRFEKTNKPVKEDKPIPVQKIESKNDSSTDEEEYVSDSAVCSGSENSSSGNEED